MQFSKMRNALVAVGTLALSVMVIGNAYLQKKQFYPSVVYITKSNPSMAVMYLQAVVIIMLLGKLMRKIFFGELRAAEVEHLVERFWYAVTETCLAFTVFKDDFTPKFMALFTLLLFLKSFHWLGEDRVDYMERSPVISWIFHTRIVLLLSLLGLLDLYFISIAYQHTITKGASVQLVFGFEYAILLTVVINTAVKYILHIIDMNREVFWENKAVFLLYVEVVIGFIKVVLYMCFVALMVKLYTLPLFAFRPMYYSMRNFKKALNDVILSRRAIRNMNTLYPDATAEELAAADNVCIICREEMQTGAKKLPCNHIFHVSCLRSWFQRHQTCPTCRLNVLRTNTATQRPRPAGAAPQAAQPNPAMPPIFAFPAWQPPFFPPAPNVNAQNVPNAGGEQRPDQMHAQASGSSAEANANQSNMPNQANPDAGVQFPQQFSFPFMLPPMPPFIPGVTTPPLPPQNWSGLSLEELRQMEENSRRGVEARLQCLRNIHTLMDASVILMQQYITSASIAAATSAATATPQGPSGSSSGAESAPTNPPTADSSEPSTSQTSPESKPAVPSTSASNVEPSGSEEVPSTSGEGESLLGSQEQEEIRRRRVQKFTSS
ncbi:E3 ubiquitin-protein ligase synoviolin B [Planococcus citri]|uniref:E3 ubiquitin-protein ligase synoviolin B n=1 Tax=Planococcus citri TaxID=170843 RepID=UPI0031F7531F